MKFALHFGNNTLPKPDDARRIAQLAEKAGFDSIFAVDHVVFPHNYEFKYPYAASGRIPGGPELPIPDPMIWMTWIAAATTKLRFMTGVIILPLRNPLVLAKQVATLDLLSGGRVEVGIGVGWLKEEFDALGVPFEKRGKRSDEYIRILRAAWKDGPTSFAGEFFSFDEMGLYPKPIRNHVPIVIGGHSDAAAKRAGKLGDGFFPSISTQTDIQPLLDLVQRSAEQAGRDPRRIELITGCADVLPKSGKDPHAAVEERIKRGVGRIAVPVWAFRDNYEEGFARFGETVIRPFSNA